jgi:chemosensory pili system protein ChpA (sensor histidine kinase/response regulator)
MPCFSLDDVRDSFTADVSAFIGRIERAAEEALTIETLKPAALWGQGRPAFGAMSNVGHAIVGTTSLVGTESLHGTARVLEELADVGEAALAEMEQAAERARAIAELCVQGAAQMRQMLALELEHRGMDAMWLATEWLARAEELRQRVAVAAGPAPSASDPPRPAEAEDGAATQVAGAAELFDFGDVPPAPVVAGDAIAEPAGDQDVEIEEVAADEGRASTVHRIDSVAFNFEGKPDDGFADELKAIFRQEGLETLRTLDAQLKQLYAQPDSLATVGNIERLFHTLKGAAATVGLEEVSRAAAKLQQRIEGVLEKGIQVTPAYLDVLVRDTNAMLVRAELPMLTAVAARTDASGAPDGANAEELARDFFLQEAQEIQQEAHALLAELNATSAETALRARGDLARLFHRLKGSALIVGEHGVGEEAERAQALLDSDAASAVGQQDVAQAARTALARVAALLSQPSLAEGSLGASAAAPSTAAPTPPAAAFKPVREPVQITTEPEMWDAFNQECGELLESLDKECLTLEESAQPRQSLEKVMRFVHTLKGVMNTIGLTPTGKELHRVEDFLETLTSAPILPPMRAVATLLIKTQNDVRRHLKEAKEGWVETSLPLLEARIAKVLVGGRARPVASGAPGQSRAEPGRETGASVHSLAEARSVRSVRSGHSARADAAAPSAVGSDEGADKKFIRVATQRLDALMNLAGELVVSRSRLLSRVGALRGLQEDIARGGKRLVEAVDTFREENEFANLDGRTRLGAPAALTPRTATALGGDNAWDGFGELELDRYEDVHVLSRRLAEIVSDVTELSGQLAKGLTAFSDDSGAFDAIVSGIQSEITRARMVPLDQLYTRLRLPVRDAAARENKDVRVATEGADVSLDKTIADAIFAPMLHLVRNAVVHGVEPASARLAAGKPALGVITLRARQDSGQIVLEVNDDGGGLDLAALRARGAKMGLINPDTPLEEPAVKDLVFAPGLSTRAQAGAVSGRGVGCDVVRRAVERMNGTIAVETAAGKGTTFIITLPVTLAITKALLVRQAGRSYAIPLYFAERIIDTHEGAVVESAGVRRLKIDDGFLTVTRLDQHFNPGAKVQGKGPVLLLRVGDQRAALQVDAVVGQEEVVVKSLGDVLAGHPLFAGVTIRGSGELVLIVDIPGLMDTKARRVERQKPQPKLDADAGDAVARADESVLAEPAAEARRTKLRVLFVDDSLSVRKYAEMTLKGLGADVTLALDGVDALARLRTESFDLVFTDLEMPRMHGFELIRELRFVPAYHDLPIIVVTSRSGQKHQQEARALGASEYITKPFSAEVLTGILRRWGTPRGEGPARDVKGETPDSEGFGG